MKIGLKNFGAFENAEIELAPLTILCGANNTGKTYAMYAIYGLLSGRFSRLRGMEDLLGIDLPESGITTVQLDTYLQKQWGHWQRRAVNGFTANLSFFFSTEPDYFKDSVLSLSSSLEAALPIIKAMSIDEVLPAPNKKILAQISKAKGSYEMTITRGEGVPKSVIIGRVADLILTLCLAPWRDHNSVWLLPAERSGLNLFYSELNRQRNALVHHASKAKIEPDKLFQDIFLARYPQPIADYIDLLNDMKTWKKQKSESAFHELALELQKVLQGKFTLDRDANVTFVPKKSKRSISLHMTSSIVKTYFGFWFYLEHMARSGDVMMIDEPELNLHPDNQRKLARLLARLVNQGQRVIISTHSDYIVREFNNLLVLNNDFEGKAVLMKKYDYTEADKLKPDAVKAYQFHKGGAVPMELDADEGIIAKTFDDVINQMNASSFDLSSALAMARATANQTTKQA